MKNNKSLIDGFLFLALYFLFTFSSSAFDSELVFSRQKDKDLYYEIIKEVRCPQCPNQSIADSSSFISEDLRRTVYKHVVTGDTRNTILQHLEKIYGSAILYRPPMNKLTTFLWFSPLIFFIFGVFLLWRFIRFRSVPVKKQQFPKTGKYDISHD